MQLGEAWVFTILWCVFMAYVVLLIIFAICLAVYWILKQIYRLFSYCVLSPLKRFFHLIDEKGVPNDIVQLITIVLLLWGLMSFSMLDQVFAAEPFLNVRFLQVMDVLLPIAGIGITLYSIRKFFQFMKQFRFTRK